MTEVHLPKLTWTLNVESELQHIHVLEWPLSNSTPKLCQGLKMSNNVHFSSSLTMQQRMGISVSRYTALVQNKVAVTGTKAGFTNSKWLHTNAVNTFDIKVAKCSLAFVTFEWY
ncbi:hypothetical protein XENOCAPTIV_028262 [Xenoophorus captivus]|uniref:Uncharacterized protein n=1 Tax=Xenoophorus captivus TaxID=1517983 RepID=A0ABV0RT43_9TELE